MTVPVVRPAELGSWLADRGTARIVAVDLDAGEFEPVADVPPGVVALGITERDAAVGNGLTCTLTSGRAESRGAVTVADVGAELARIGQRVAVAPSAAAALVDVLSAGRGLDVRDALVVESLAYSMLLAGPEFARWLRRRGARAATVPGDSAPVCLTRTGRELGIRLDRPSRRNAVDVTMRDAILEGLALAAADDSVERVLLTGAGADFCSGGDLAEFGTTSDTPEAHRIRLATSVGLRLAALADRVEARLHGHCVGAGIELPAFAGRVTAADDTSISLPELAMGLIPGAGGTVSLTRRIGRWRTAYLALSGDTIDAGTALRWGLVDART